MPFADLNLVHLPQLVYGLWLLLKNTKKETEEISNIIHLSFLYFLFNKSSQSPHDHMLN